MNRLDHFNYIEKELSGLAYRIETRGSLNLLDLHLHSEDLYRYLINLLFDWELNNINTIQQNMHGIDLVDATNKIVAQVSATATKQKIESALTKDLSGYNGYSFKFISISKDAKELRTKTFANPHNLKFIPSEDIFDIKSLLSFIKSMSEEKIKGVYEFLRKELKHEPDPEAVESNLIKIINILAKENWSQVVEGFEIVPYEIEKKILYNQLNTSRVLIDEYKTHSPRIDKIYSDFDKLGSNKSLSILNRIRMEYLELGPEISPDQCFFSIIKKITQKIQANVNCPQLAEEELDLCVQILVVDAFMRCKIFQNPIGDTYARS